MIRRNKFSKYAPIGITRASIFINPGNSVAQQMGGEGCF